MRVCRQRNTREQQIAVVTKKVADLEPNLRAMVRELREVMPDLDDRAKELSNAIYDLMEVKHVPFAAAIIGTGASLGGLLLAYLRDEEKQP